MKEAVYTYIYTDNNAHVLAVDTAGACDLTFDNIEDYISYLLSLDVDEVRVYMYRLEVQGSYIMNYIMDHYKEYKKTGNDTKRRSTIAHMPAGTFTYMIAPSGAWYNILLKGVGIVIDFRDIHKIIRKTLDEIRDDICQDVSRETLIMKKVIEEFADAVGDTPATLGMTIGSEALKGFKQTLDDNIYEGHNFKRLFPYQNREIMADTARRTYDEYVRASYRGGWNYINPDIIGKEIEGDGVVLDVNSLYAYVMHSVSRNAYPVGNGVYHEGEPSEWDKDALNEGTLYAFLEVEFEFDIAPVAKCLPCIQIRDDLLYDPSAWLHHSTVKIDGREITNRVHMVVTWTDWKLYHQTYHLYNIKYCSYIIYQTRRGIFDKYIDKWYSIKQDATGTKRMTAKLMINNISGKFATKPDGSYVTLSKMDGIIQQHVQEKDDVTRAVYIPVGAAITSYARAFIIKKARELPQGSFLYSDTDSLHFVNVPRETYNHICYVGKGLGEFKIEHTFKRAKYIGLKRYILEDDKSYNVTCAGITPEGKEYLQMVIDSSGMECFKFGMRIENNKTYRWVEGGKAPIEIPIILRNNLLTE